MDKSSILNNIGVDKETVISEGLSFFLKKQDPDDVEFVAADNGWALKVRTNEENTEKAKKFWEEDVQPKLSGE